MKFLLFLACVILASCNSESEKKKNIPPLRNLQNFEVVALFSPYEQYDQKMICNILIDSFKNIGEVTVVQDASMFATLPQLQSSAPICYFSIGKIQNRIEIVLNVIAEVEVITNQSKITCPIWTNKASAEFMSDNFQLEVAGIIKNMIKEFAEEYSKANPGKTRVAFLVREFQHL